jgi:hypothetical protein
MATSRTLGDLPQRARELADDLRERTIDLAGDLQEQVVHTANTLPDREELTRRAGIGVLEGAQAVIGLVVAVPRLFVRALRIARELTERAERVADHSHELRARARRVAQAVEAPRRARRRRRVESVGLVAAGFGVGVAVGWFVADRRIRAEREHDAAQARAHAEMVRAADLQGSGTADATPDVGAVPGQGGEHEPTLAPVEPHAADGQQRR